MFSEPRCWRSRSQLVRLRLCGDHDSRSELSSRASISWPAREAKSQPSLSGKPGTSNLQLSTRVFMDPNTRKTHGKSTRNTPQNHENTRKHTHFVFWPALHSLPPFSFSSFDNRKSCRSPL